MSDRFVGPDGRRAVLEAVADQWLVGGHAAIAEELVTAGDVKEHPPDSVLIEQDATDRAILLILSGDVAVLVNGREVARRTARQHVGEMALADLRSRRCARVVARSAVSVLRVGEPQFDAVALKYPQLWRRIAVELSERLRQRNTLVGPQNEVPVMFVGSSKEGLEIARAIQAGLEHDRVVVRVWTDGIFGPSGIAIDDLIQQAQEADFATLVVGPDDEIASRGATAYGPRDNVVFELGLFMGPLGRQRTFMLIPRGVDIKLPTDVLGVTPVTYDPARTADLRSCLGTACTELRERIRRLGAR
jgi:CRP/FNR family transcriptional regulator, cyclic AMP receptor protein